MALPRLDLADDPHRVSSAVRPGDVARELLVRDVGVVFEGTAGLDDVDVPSLLAAGERSGQFGGPDGGLQQPCEVDVVRGPALAVVGDAARDEAITDLEWGLGPVEERSLDVIAAFMSRGRTPCRWRRRWRWRSIP